VEGCSPSIRPISKLLCTLPLSSRHPGNASHTRVIHEHQIAGSLLAHHQAATSLLHHPQRYEGFQGLITCQSIQLHHLGADGAQGEFPKQRFPTQLMSLYLETTQHQVDSLDHQIDDAMLFDWEQFGQLVQGFPWRAIAKSVTPFIHVSPAILNNQADRSKSPQDCSARL